MRPFFITILTLVAACTQAPSTTEAPPEPPVMSERSAAMLSALTPVIAAEIGGPVRLDLKQVNVQEEWAWLAVQPLRPDGSAIVWSTTALASRYENGAMDESGATYALLEQENGAWRIVTHVIAPTDMAWLSWPAEYGAPAEIMGFTDLRKHATANAAAGEGDGGASSGQMGPRPLSPGSSDAASRRQQRISQRAGHEPAQMRFPSNRQRQKGHQHHVDAQKARHRITHLGIGQRRARARPHRQKICPEQAADRSRGADRAHCRAGIDQNESGRAAERGHEKQHKETRIANPAAPRTAPPA